MPIRATIDGVEVVSTDIPASSWHELVVLTRRNRALATMPCGKGAVLKRSKLGWQFFAHYPSTHPCDYPHKVPETQDHIRIKAALLQGCRDSGWTATPEFLSEDRSWRADVLAHSSERRVAFEIQWTRQSEAETERRDHEYSRANVQAWWLFRRLPPTASRVGLPMFAVERDESTGSDLVVVPGYAAMPIGSFVRHVLLETLQFRELVTPDSRVPLALTFEERSCPGCRAPVYFPATHVPTLLSPCGRRLEAAARVLAYELSSLAERLTVGEPDALGLLPSSREAMEVRGHLVLRYKPGKEFVTFANGGGFCRRCHHDMPRVNTVPSSIPLAIPLGPRQVSISEPHWCLSETRCFCETRRLAPPNSVLELSSRLAAQ